MADPLMNGDKLWQMEYYCGFPNIRIQFVVRAPTFEDAIHKGDKAISSLRRVGTYTTTFENARHN